MNTIQSMNGNNPAAIFNDPAAVAAAESAKARIQSAYIMALQKPRNYDNARLKILAACKRPDFAEKAEYTKPVGGSTLTGPSIRFAELALREWGNVTYENQVVFDDMNVRRIRVTVTDLESNATFSKEIQLSKTVERKSSKGREVISERLNSYGDTVYLVRATEDEVTTREAALISKALRNEGLRLIPQEIIEEGMAVARQTVQSRDKKDPDAARKQLTEAFFAYGVKPMELEKYLGHSLDQCQPDELQELRSIYAAIRDGEARWAGFMETKEAERAEKEQTNKASSDDVMTQIMNAPAPTGERKSRRAPKTEQHRELEPATLEEPQNQGVPPVLEPAQSQPPVEPGTPASPSSSQGMSSLELARKNVLDLIGPDGLGLRPDEHEKYFTGITGKDELKSLTQADLQAVINDATARLAKRDE